MSMRRVDSDTSVSMGRRGIGVKTLRYSGGIIGSSSIVIGLSGNGIVLN